MKGVLNIDKPSGWTSQDVVSKIKRILGEKTVGHMGTLDPQGTGVLIVGVGKAARLFNHYLNKDKVYEAEFEFGRETDTLDKDGKILRTTLNIPSQSEIIRAAQGQVGALKQTPPQYSAKSVGGVRAHVLARNGIELELKPAAVEVYGIKFLNKTAPDTYKFEIHCSSGTYIRSICRDIAYSLNSLATMVSINRTRAGAFELKDSIGLQALEALKEKALISIEDALKDVYRLELDGELYPDLIKGKKIPFECDREEFTVYCKNELFGLGKIKDGILKIDTYLKD